MNTNISSAAPGSFTQNTTTHHNPLDRNGDGRVDLKDLSGRNNLAQNNMAGVHHNPLDRNGDGRVDLNDLSGRRLSQGYDASLLQGQTAYVQNVNRSSITAQPTVLETIQKDVVVHERIHPMQKEEIQPIIYREREQLDVKQVTQMLHETQIQPTLVQQRELPAERREAIVERAGPIAENIVLPTREIDATLRTQVVHAPIVNEIIKKTVIEEIQPVLERDIIQSTVIQNTQPIYEKIVEAPTVYRETIITSQSRGIIGGGSLEALEAQGFNLGTTGQRLSGQYSQAQLAGAGINVAPLSNETLLTSNGLKRRSLVEALPNSYSHLGGQNLDSKLVQQEMMAGNMNSALPAKNLL